MYDDAGFQVAKGSGWLDNLTSNTLRDLDGTLTGTAGSVVVSDNAYLSNSTCSVKTTPLASSYTGFRICSPGFQSLNLFLGGTSNINKIPFIMVKDSNTSSLANLSHLSILADPARGTYLNKVGLITSSNHSYDMLFRKTDLNGDILDNLSFHANSESPNLSTPLIRLHGLGTNCKLNNNAVQVSSLSALSSNTSAAAYYSSGNDFVVKFKTVNFESNLINPSATGPGHGLHTSNAHGYSCTGPVVSGIKGTIDSVKQVGTKIEVTGWACDYGEETSIPVHIYIGGSAGTPGAVGYAVTANASSEPAISIACGRAFSSYRFKWSAERTTLASLIGKKVYAHGLSATNGPNLLISNSGTYSIP
jgi:hypothetical protein